jgi:polysaccharide pyruvyl transferase WcaK-like protein
MTRKDYVLIAAALKAACPTVNVTYRACVDSIANALGLENARFDRERFLKACGVTT